MKTIPLAELTVSTRNVRTTSQQLTYEPTHPWFYKLGGRPLYPKQIREMARQSSIPGYRHETIVAAEVMAEPRRSNRLNSLRQETLADLRRNLAGYRQTVCRLRGYRHVHGRQEQPTCNDVDVNVSLKLCHLLNDFAHLDHISELLSRQGDLFGLFDANQTGSKR